MWTERLEVDAQQRQAKYIINGDGIQRTVDQWGAIVDLPIA
jgi:hypothetical protein